jgi:hypothetical protein
VRTAAAYALQIFWPTAVLCVHVLRAAAAAQQKADCSMEPIRTAKRSAAAASNPLGNSSILQHVLSYLGLGHWFFAATVCSLWRRIYEGLASTMLLKIQSEPITVPKLRRCVPKMTLLSAVLASPSRLRLARNELPVGGKSSVMSYAIGLCADVTTIAAAADELCIIGSWKAIAQGIAASGCVSKFDWFCSNEHRLPGNTDMYAAKSGSLSMLEFVLSKKQRPPRFSVNLMAAAVAHSPPEVCKHLHEKGCPWSAYACYLAAAGNNLATLRWLHENGCPGALCDDSSIAAARCGSVDIMLYMQQQGVQWSDELLTLMPNTAGAFRHLAAVQWLRQQGAQWPLVLRVCDKRWGRDVITWARQEGCTAPTKVLV